MAAKIIKLLAPNDLPIVGIRMEDGTVCEFVYSYDNLNLVFDMVLKNKGSANILNRDGCNVFVDSAGNEWPASDIDEYDSILRS
ncbi:hypothetical protein [Candidatus Accumulibacter sp. ACC003]|uniref:hypothetical protein n=1 Tax=Candidatus Accumulibacter sp. ACC003 TaxID=2823334 RepID=UPI0025B84F2E|nr:hypothetical protein [Candidatus Accumulibacter sp. ACC003]